MFCIFYGILWPTMEKYVFLCIFCSGVCPSFIFSWIFHASILSWYESLVDLVFLHLVGSNHSCRLDPHCCAGLLLWEV